MPWYRDKKRLIVAVTALAAVACILALVVLLRGGTDAKAKIMASMREANGGADPELSYDGDQLVSIEGIFSSVRATDEASALSAFGEVAPLFGVYRPTEELELDRVEEDQGAGTVTYVFVLNEKTSEDSESDAGESKQTQRVELAVTADEDGTIRRAERREVPEEELVPQAQMVTLLVPVHTEYTADEDEVIVDATYDENGRLARKEVKPATKAPSTTRVLYGTFEFSYDDEGRLSSVNLSDTLAQGGAYDGTWNIEYSSDGLSMKATYASSGSEADGCYVQEEYDSDGRLIDRRYRLLTDDWSKGIVLGNEHREVYIYDDAGRMTKAVSGFESEGTDTSPMGMAYRSVYEFSYEASGLLGSIVCNGYMQGMGVEDSEKDYTDIEDFAPTSVGTYVFDNGGNLVRCESHSEMNGSYTTIDLTYAETGIPQSLIEMNGYEGPAEVADWSSIESLSDDSYTYTNYHGNGTIRYQAIECAPGSTPLLAVSTMQPGNPDVYPNIWDTFSSAYGNGSYVLTQVWMNNRMMIADASTDADVQEDGNADLEALYAAKLEEYVQTYGMPHLVNNQVCAGVCVAQLLDFNADGTDELLIVYYDESLEEFQHIDEGMSDPRAYIVEVWTKSGNRIAKAHEQRASGTNGGLPFLNLYRALEGTTTGQGGNNVWWIERHMESTADENGLGHTLYRMDDEAFAEVHRFSVINEHDPNSYILVDGERTDIQNDAEWIESIDEIVGKASYGFTSSLDSGGSIGTDATGTKGYPSDKCIELTKETMRELGLEVDG